VIESRPRRRGDSGYQIFVFRVGYALVANKLFFYNSDSVYCDVYGEDEEIAEHRLYNKT